MNNKLLVEPSMSNQLKIYVQYFYIHIINKIDGLGLKLEIKITVL